MDLEFGKVLREIRESKKMSINQLAAKSGVSNSQISRIESGDRGVPKPDTIHKFAAALEVPYEVLMAAAGFLPKNIAVELYARNKIQFPDSFSDTEKELFETYRESFGKLSNARRRAVEAQEKEIDASRRIAEIAKQLIERIDGLEEQIAQSDNLVEITKTILDINELDKVVDDTRAAHNDRDIRYARIPVLGSIRAGEPINMVQENEEYVIVDPNSLRVHECFGLRVKGDSMTGDRINDGDLVIILKSEEVHPHEIAVVAINNEEATLKRVKIHGDTAILIPSNSQHEPIVVPTKDIRILGKVIEVRFTPK